MDSTLYNAITGFAAGDAAGVPYEFKKRGTFICRDMRASTFRDSHLLLPIGSWSDDTAMMLCVLDALTIKQCYHRQESPPMTRTQLKKQSLRIQHKVYRRFRRNAISWLTYGKYTNHFYRIPYDVGNACRRGIFAMMFGLRNKRADNITSNGNGGLMRILPLAFATYNDDNELMEYIKLFNHCSHNHQISHIGCFLYIKFAQNLQISGISIEKALQKTVIEMPKAYLLPEYQRIWDISILNDNIETIKSTGYVVDTLEAVLWSLAHANDYTQTVLTAINLGGDTDTIAALAGGLAGIYYENVNKTWVNKTRKAKMLAKICQNS